MASMVLHAPNSQAEKLRSLRATKERTEKSHLALFHQFPVRSYHLSKRVLVLAWVDADPLNYSDYSQTSQTTVSSPESDELINLHVLVLVDSARRFLQIYFLVFH